MAVTVGMLYKESTKYKMNYLAGEEGFGNIVDWVHMIETVDGANFLHGQELILTAGILEQDEQALLQFVQTVYEKNASALVINTGMFVHQIPASVIDFCNEHKFPLFSIPWIVPLVDVTKDYCQRIIDDDVREDNIITVFKNLIFQIGNKEEGIRQMERFGYLGNCVVQCICIQLDIEKGTHAFVTEAEKLAAMVKRLACEQKKQYLTFEYQERRIVILFDYTQEAIDDYVDKLFKKLSERKMLSFSYIGLSDNVKGLECQSENFKHAFCACDIAQKKQEHILKYRDMGLYKLFVNISSSETINEYYQETLGKLLEYDKENATEIYRFIKIYIACDGHQGKVSDTFFVHRNTVNNYVKKAEDIMDIDLSSWEGRTKLYIACLLEAFLQNG